VFGAGQWTESVHVVPGRPSVPPDHWIESHATTRRTG
jgi:hypothetical protein